MSNIEVVKSGRICYIYTRVSTEIQVDGYSLEAQEEECRRYATASNMKVARVYSDEGKSGKNTDGRPEFKRMLHDIEENRDGATFILVFKLSRFGRNATDTLSNLQFLEEHDTYLWSTHDGIDNSTVNGRFMMVIFSAMAEMERVNILEQTQAGRNQKAKSGKWNGGKPPIGYSLDPENDTLVINEDEAKIVRAVFEQFLLGLSYNAIADYLNLHFKKPIRQSNDNPLFAAHNVRRMLDDQTYIGLITYGKTCTETIVNKKTKKKEAKRVKQTDPSKIITSLGNFEHIIDDDVWERAQRKREKHKEKYTRTENPAGKHIYPLTGLIVCPECGRRLDGHPNKGKLSPKTGLKGADTFDYCCKNNGSTPRGHKKCPFNRHLNDEKLCAEIIAIIDNASKNELYMKGIADRINSSVDVSELETEKEKLEKLYRNAQTNLTQLSFNYDHLDSEAITDFDLFEIKKSNLQSRISDLYVEMAKLNKSIKEVDSKISAAYESKLTEKKIYSVLSHFKAFYNTFNDEQKKTCLHMLIESIELQNYHIKRIDYSNVIKSITFRFPFIHNGSGNPFVFLPENDPDETVVCLSKNNSKK